MRIQGLLFAGTVFCGLLTAVDSVFAQGMVFTYQGQLYNNGSPASGTYNLTFSLFNTNTSGVPLAGPVTNNAVGVTNGLFTVLIDFGPGVFTGQTNWLEIAVATNGGNTFTTLAARQQLTPVPYAIYAANAGTAVMANSASSVPAANIVGTLTNNTTGNAASATYAASAGTASNTVFFSQDPTNLDNYAYQAFLSANINSGASLNRYAYKRTMAKLSSNQGATILYDGDGYLNNGLFDRAVVDLLSAYPLKGAAFQVGAPNYHFSMDGTGSAVFEVNGKDTNWMPSYWEITNANDTVYYYNNGGSSDFPANQFSFYYQAWPMGGNIELEQMTNGVSWTPVPGYSSFSTYSNTANNGMVISWTNPAVFPTRLEVVGLASPGTNIIYGWKSFNNTLTNGILWEEYAIVGGPTPNLVPDSIRLPVWNDLNPDLVVMEYASATNLPISYYATNYFNYYTSNFPNTELVFSTEMPNLTPGDLSNRTGPALACASYGYGFFDGWNLYTAGGLTWPSTWTNNYNRGLMSSDGTHPSSAGYTFHGELFSRWLDLASAAQLVNNANSPAFTGVITNNGSRSWVTNGIIIKVTVP